jgi:hypothetical protein
LNEAAGWRCSITLFSDLAPRVFVHKALGNIERINFSCISFLLLEIFFVVTVPSQQGDQIGRIFAHWVTDFFEQFSFGNYKSNSHILATPGHS